jgi:hypothetical protein
MNAFKNVLTWLGFGVTSKLNMFKIYEGSEERAQIMYVLTCYLSYLAISIALTVWVARTLHKSGRVFLVDAFHGNTELADSVNHLLVVGFYLINVGYITVALKTTEALTTSREVIELESGKVGVVLLMLGAMHFFNIFVLGRMRYKARSRANHRESMLA